MKKILVTLGPASLDTQIIQEMEKENVYLFRLNMSHTAEENLEDHIRVVQSSTEVPLCIDSEGAQIRSMKMVRPMVDYHQGQVVRIPFEGCVGDEESIGFTPIGVAARFEVGDVLDLDFDLTSMKIIEKHKNHALAEVIRPGKVGTNKAVSLSRHLDLPAITDKDRKAIAIGVDMGIRDFALSFSSQRQDIEEMRRLAGVDIRLISKVESMQGLINIKEVLDASDDILIDRGDLSSKIPLEKIPMLQRRIISVAKICDCPAFVATNLLESMVISRVPTRAEVNDVISTILMGADGLVLAAETAVGNYPVLAVKMVRSLVDMCRKWTPNTNIMEILEM